MFQIKNPIGKTLNAQSWNVSEFGGHMRAILRLGMILRTASPAPGVFCLIDFILKPPAVTFPLTEREKKSPGRWLWCLMYSGCNYNLGSATQSTHCFTNTVAPCLSPCSFGPLSVGPFLCGRRFLGLDRDLHQPWMQTKGGMRKSLRRGGQWLGELTLRIVVVVVKV
jgi:hypothetical protein